MNAETRELFVDTGWSRAARPKLDDDLVRESAEPTRLLFGDTTARPRLAPWPGFKNESTLAFTCAVGAWLAMGLVVIVASVFGSAGGFELQTFVFGCVIWSWLLWFFGSFMGFIGVMRGTDNGPATVALILCLVYMPVFVFTLLSSGIALALLAP